MALIVQHIYPPIPSRDFDWCCYEDAESGVYGYGRTEQEAINDYKQQKGEK